ncbi:MAG TPA: universal stress protein [Thermomicrobiales bacterium]|nr:universal stress protein [Thermomicrobiales bacterium]
MNPQASTPFRILVPLDGSSQASRALEISRQLKPERLLLLRVLADKLLGIPRITLGSRDEESGPLREELETIAAPLRAAGTDVEVMVVFGDAAEEIIAAGQRCDLIVMTTRGQGAASRALFGSVADRVSRHSITPTMLIRSMAGTTVTPRQRIVVPLDGSHRAELALPMATRLASILTTPVHIVRVIDLDDVRATISDAQRKTADAPDIGETFDDARLFTEEQALSYLETVAVPLREQGLEINTEVLRGTPAFVLLWSIKAADLVVMTSHGRGGFRRWVLGSVAEKLVREGEAPLVIIPTRDTEA